MNNQPMQPQTPDPSQFGQYSDWAKENLAKGVSADALQQVLSQQTQQSEQPNDCDPRCDAERPADPEQRDQRR